MLALALVLMSGWLLPASAHSPRIPVGDQLVLTGCFFGPQDPDVPAAGEPFHVKHGWLLDLGGSSRSLGWSDFRLLVDGVEQPSLLIVTMDESEDSLRVSRAFLTNFPDGLPSGTYEFTGVWTGWSGDVYDCTYVFAFD